MRYKVLLFFLLVLWVAQTAKSQDVALKTNTLMWATTTPNLGLEVALSPRYTLELSGSYNPWTFKDDKKMRFWLVQPELKYWFCEKSEGTLSVCTCMGRSTSGIQEETLRWLSGRRRFHLRVRLDSLAALEPGGRHRYRLCPPVV